MTMPPLRLSIIRHGETAWSLTGQHTGRTDLALTAEGENQARALKPLLADIDFTHVLSSPLQRAVHTCALAGFASVVEIEPDLAEWDYGDYEGRLSRDIRLAHPGWNCFEDGCPNGESLEQITRRAERLIERLSTLHGDVALFTHGEFACALASVWVGGPVSGGQHLTLSTGSLSVLTTHLDHPEIRVISLWNLSAALLAA
jgi:probable phosphoglycerate mutase